ncbi:MAG: hypothetical protein MJ252_25550 [archaeon]|nr:hypothetical protein [archaeon]
MSDPKSSLIIKVNSDEFIKSHFFTRIEIMDMINSLVSLRDSQVEEIEFLKTSLLFYYWSKCDSSFKDSFKTDIVNLAKIQLFNPLNQLYILFNIWEYDHRYNILSESQIEELTEIYRSLNEAIEDDTENIEDSLLYEYYNIVILYKTNQYAKGRLCCNAFLEKFRDERYAGLIRSDKFFDYLKLKCNLLLWNFNRILNDNPVNFVKLSNELMEILGNNYLKIAGKIICSFVDCSGYNAGNYQRCASELEKIYKKLKTEFFYNSQGETSQCNRESVISSGADNITLFMEILYRMIYCYLMLNDKPNAKRIYKKIAKNYNHLLKDEKLSSDFIIDYNYIVKLSKYSTLDMCHDIAAILKTIEEFNKGKNPSIENIINFFALRQRGQSLKTFTEKLAKLYNLLKQEVTAENCKNFKGQDFVTFIFMIYNYISYISNILTTNSKNLMDGSSIYSGQDDQAKKRLEAQKNQMYKEMHSCAYLIINYLNSACGFNNHLKNVLGLGYIKDICMKICFACSLGSYHLHLENSEERSLIDRFTEKISGRNCLGFMGIWKLKADEQYKKEDFKGAFKLYANINNTLTENTKLKAMIFFNMGLCSLNFNEFDQGKTLLLKSLEMMNEIKGRVINIDCSLHYDFEMQIVNEIINKLKL